jgi:hydrogenase maturation protease
MHDNVTKLLVAACGNVMASDDAFGPLVARALGRLDLPNIEIIDLDIRPAALLDHLAGRSGLIILDAVYAPDAQPGNLLDIDWFDEDRPALVNDDTMSTHGLSIGRQLELAQTLNMLPLTVRLIAVTLNDKPRVGQPRGDYMMRCVAHAVECVLAHARSITRSNVERKHA